MASSTSIATQPRHAATSLGPVILPSEWDQTAPRAYVSTCFCFPLKEHNVDALKKLERHLRASIRSLAKQLPDLAGRLSVNPVGKLEFVPSKDRTIRFQFTVHRNQHRTYAELKRRGFPQGELLFLKLFDTPLVTGSIMVVRAVVIPGGLLLGIF